MPRRSRRHCGKRSPSSSRSTRLLVSARRRPRRSRSRRVFEEAPIWVAELAGKLVGTVAAVPRAALSSTSGAWPYFQRPARATRRHPAPERHRDLCRRPSVPPAWSSIQRRFCWRPVQLYERHRFRRTGEQSDLFGTPLATIAKELPAR
jgi:hypothetical protein